MCWNLGSLTVYQWNKIVAQHHYGIIQLRFWSYFRLSINYMDNIYKIVLFIHSKMINIIMYNSYVDGKINEVYYNIV